MTGDSSRYEVLALIASGGMGSVHVGRRRGAIGFSRLVAIKRPHASVVADPAARRELEREARIASSIHHANVVSVLDVEEIGNELVLVMDYVEGCTLRDLVEHATESERSGEAPSVALDRAAIRIVLDVAAGLHAAHSMRDAEGNLLGIVHRDVSPHNVLVGVDGVARLTDFGIAKVTNTERDHTASHGIKGKLAYLAPEYASGRPHEARSDLFALAVVTWEALLRRRLFKAATSAETLLRILQTQAPLLSTVRPELAPLDDLLASALSTSPAQRPASVEAFASELEARARNLGLVATHGQVAGWVERVAGAQLNARRLALESPSLSAGSDVGRAGADADDPATASMTLGTSSATVPGLPAALAAAGEATVLDVPPVATATRALESTHVIDRVARRSEVAAHESRSNRRPWLPAAVALTVAVIGVGGWLGYRKLEGAPTSASREVSPPLATSEPTAPPREIVSAQLPSAAAEAPPPVQSATLPPDAGRRPHRARPAGTLVPQHAPANPYAR